jgi:hypothetical protein
VGCPWLLLVLFGLLVVAALSVFVGPWSFVGCRAVIIAQRTALHT